MDGNRAKRYLGRMDEALADRFAAIVGGRHALAAPGDIAPFLEEPRSLVRSHSPLVLKPGSTEQVAGILALANATGTAVVPQGGNTGHAGGQVPEAGTSQLIVSLSRLNRIRAVDPAGDTLTVEAGCVLEDIRKAADVSGRLFPLSLASGGSCQIGGNLASNAGGTAVLAYGGARQLCLGLEVVLANGDVWDGLRRLKKDNAGLDLRDLFIGSEGTLGIITAAVLKLFAKPRSRQVALAGLAGPRQALGMFRIAEETLGPALTGFELMPRFGIDLTARFIPGNRDPLPDRHPWYALIDISSGQAEEASAAVAEAVLEKGFGEGLVADATIARSTVQRKALWRLRETMSEAQKHAGAAIKHDVSAPVSAVPAFIARADEAVLSAMPGARVCAFGHLGDGNVHYDVIQPEGTDAGAHLARTGEINDIVYGIVLDLGGSISAEHGIGQFKRDRLAAIRQPVEMDLMRRIKAALDPVGIMNPGKVIAMPQAGERRP